ncbi:MAG TPA: sugar transferase [Acidimicrobiales bacterium]|nr:sugar transferase [Acidimicrobiales bacterium]
MTWAAPRQAVLRRVLVATDVAAIAGVWLWVLGPVGGIAPGGPAGLLGSVAAVTAGALGLMASQKLYLARVCRVRAIELSRLLRVSILTGALVHLVGARWGMELSVSLTVVAVVAMAAALSTSRGCYNLWLRGRRARGRSTRPVVVVGDADESENLGRLLRDHPEMGFEAVASVPPSGQLMDALRSHGADTVILATAAFDRAGLNRVTRRLLDAGIHVHLSTGLSGFDHRRLRAQPLAREPLFYLEPLTVSPWQQVVKRALDVVGSTVGLVVSLPVLAAAAVAVKLEDGGPVLFRHRRVGQDGEEFTVYKLRTMVPRADRQLHLVAGVNQRGGPLFKSHHDPRVTRVGRVLRATSVDELPQLLNVLLGTMSLVGPRPALAHEVAQFDAELRTRERVRPGITGLWQIEGRDDPSFDAYRRLDLFYVENWTLELDLVILFSTARAVVTQALRDLRRQWRQSGVPVTAPVHVMDLSGAESVTLGASAASPTG